MTAARACRDMDLAHVERNSRGAKTRSSIGVWRWIAGEPLVVRVARASQPAGR